MTISAPDQKAAGIAFERLGSGEPLVLIHGTGGSRAHWAPVVELLEPKYELLLLDLPGHGASDPPPPTSAHTPIAYAELTARLFDELDIDTAHVVGNSVGGWTALELAKLGRARSVVALSPAGLWPRRDPWRCWVALWSQRKLGRLFAPIVPSLLASDFWRVLLMSGTIGNPKQMPADAAIDMFRTYTGTPSFDEHLKETRRERFEGGKSITVPVTVVWGEKDRLLPRKARQTVELPEHAKILTAPGCGHIPMWDNPQALARILTENA